MAWLWGRDKKRIPVKSVQRMLQNGIPFIDVRDYGAKGDGETDDAPAINRAIQSLSSPFNNPDGGVIFVPRGVYRLASSINIAKHLILQGEGAGEIGYGTTFKVDAGITGIIIEWPLNSPLGGRGDRSILKDFSIYAVAKSGTAHGIRAYSRFHLENFLVKGFSGNGIHIEATAPMAGNANCWSIKYGRSFNNGGHGVFVDGPDVNAGVCIGVDCMTNGGWGFYDSSFLGNTYVGCHTADNTLGAYRADDASSANVFVGCYSEGGQPPSDFTGADRTVVLGGMHAAEIAGTNSATIFGRTIQNNSLRFRANRAGEPNTVVEIGEPSAGGGRFLSFIDINDYYSWAMKNAGDKRAIAFNAYGVDSNNIFFFAIKGTRVHGTWGSTGERELLAGTPFIEPDKGIHLGGIRLAQRNSLPISGTWHVGDIIFNRSAVAGGKIGWVCVTSGTAGTYAGGKTATADGSNNVTISGPGTIGVNEFLVGDFLTINGVGARITNKVGQVLTMSAAIPAGSGLAIAYGPAPTFKAFGSIDP